MSRYIADHLMLVFEDNDVSVFESVSSMLRYLEPIDVLNGIFKVFKGDGSCGELTVTTTSHPQQGTIAVQFVPTNHGSKEELSQRVQDHLAASGIDRVVKLDNLSTVVWELRQRIGITT